MELIVDTAMNSVEIAGAENLRALAVRAPVGADDAAVGSALGAAHLGSVEDGNAWIDAATLRVRAQTFEADPGWGADFEAMLRYARSKGWWRDRDGAVRAHIIRG